MVKNVVWGETLAFDGLIVLLRTKKTCKNQKCIAKSEKLVPFTDIQVHLNKSYTVFSTLRMDYAPRKVSDWKGCSHKCFAGMDENEKKESGTQVVRISEFPRILVINLMRFKNNGSKKSDTIVNNLDFDLTKFSHFREEGNDMVMSKLAKNLTHFLQNNNKYCAKFWCYRIQINQLTNNQQQYKYKLQSIIVHQGLYATSGHYYAVCRNDKDEFWKYNDSAPPKRIFEHDMVNLQAYIAIYELQ